MSSVGASKTEGWHKQGPPQLLSYHTDIGICYCQTQNLIVASTIYEPNGRGVVTGEWVDKIIDSVTTTTSLNARAPISTSLPPIPLNSIPPFCFVSLKFNPNLPSIQNPWISLQGTWLLSSKGLKVLMSYNVFKPERVSSQAFWGKKQLNDDLASESVYITNIYFLKPKISTIGKFNLCIK